MQDIRRRVRRWVKRVRDADGQALVEYALILALVAVVVVVGLSHLGNVVNNVVSNVATHIANG
ncbi:MAG: Flp family type IVb pilin [Actinomycetia bacterium]|nr:Flp family type IVb pilin [Actinomycetes bacterium]